MKKIILLFGLILICISFVNAEDYDLNSTGGYNFTVFTKDYSTTNVYNIIASSGVYKLITSISANNSYISDISYQQTLNSGGELVKTYVVFSYTDGTTYTTAVTQTTIISGGAWYNINYNNINTKKLVNSINIYVTHVNAPSYTSSVRNINFNGSTYTDGLKFNSNLDFATVNITSDGCYINVSNNGLTWYELNASGQYTFNNYINKVYFDINDTTACSWFVIQAQNYAEYYKTFNLIDEVTSSAFNSSNITQSKLYYNTDDFYDFKAEGTSSITVSLTNNSKFRFYFEYPGSEIVTRYFDVDLYDDVDTIRVCANKDNVEHIEQLIISGYEKPVKILSNYANCYIVGDYTRFAYGDTLSLVTYTINTPYILYTYDDGVEIILAYIDGSIQATSGINIDVLEFNKNAFNTALSNDGLSFYGFSNDTVKIQYVNNDVSNTEFILNIYDIQKDILLYTIEPSDPNNWVLYFDYSVFQTNSTTVFKFVGDITETSTTRQIVRYFTPSGGSGIINSPFGLAIWFFVLFFGLSIFAAGTILSYFGMIIIMIALAILAVTVQTQYVILAEAITISLFLFLGIIIAKSNPNWGIN